MSSSLDKPQLGVSACLMGQAVRFDGGHKKNQFILNECAEHFALHTVCPEAEMGLGIPRPTIQLREFEHEVRLVYSRQTDVDITEEMKSFSQQRISQLPELDGFIFKKDSPSCGVERVAIVSDKTGMRRKQGMGLFAEEFVKQNPNVPVEEEGRLNDLPLRENFLERVYAHYRWRQIFVTDNALKAFREFHKNYKLVLMAKNNQAYRELGRLAARVNKHNFEDIKDEYFSRFMRVMRSVPSTGQHINVLMHVQGYLKQAITAKDKAELHDWFEAYRSRKVNRVTPLVLLKHHFLHYPNEYIEQQYYLDPFPDELMQPV